MYKLDWLIDKFLDHAEKHKKSNKRLISEFIENNPNEPLPDYFKDDFNLCTALATICSEIVQIKVTVTSKINTTRNFQAYKMKEDRGSDS